MQCLLVEPWTKGINKGYKMKLFRWLFHCKSVYKLVKYKYLVSCSHPWHASKIFLKFFKTSSISLLNDFWYNFFYLNILYLQASGYVIQEINVLSLDSPSIIKIVQACVTQSWIAMTCQMNLFMSASRYR